MTTITINSIPYEVPINELMHGDCLMHMKGMPSNFVDLILSSPPYDNLRVYNGFKFHFKHIARHLFRIIKDGGVLVWVVADATINGSETGTSFKQALFFMECGFRLHDTQIYAKKNYIPLTHNRYEQSWEYMFVFSKGKPKTFNPIMVECKEGGITRNWSRKGYCSTIKEGASRRRNEDITTATNKIAPNIFYYSCGSAKTGHPAPFPDQLATDVILTWSNEGDLIYDPFAGSATTLKQAQKLKRNWMGSEISEDYVKSDTKKLKQLLQVKTLF